MAKIPGSLETQTREPLDGKYWIQDFTKLDTGLTFQGLLRFSKDDDKLYLKLDNGWTELLTSDNNGVSAFDFTIGTVVAGNTASVVNVGTNVKPKLNFVLPKGDQGIAGTIAVERVEVSPDSYAHIQNIGTTTDARFVFQIPKGQVGPKGSMFTINAQGSLANRNVYDNQATDFVYLIDDESSPDDGFIYIKIDRGWSTKISFRGQIGESGKSAWVAYAQDQNGLGATFTATPTTKYVAFFLSLIQPTIGAFSNWQRFVGENGTPGGPAGESAYTTYVRSGHPNATEADFLNSLKGTNGLSAYQIWLSLGNVGTEQDFFTSLSGAGVTKVYVDAADTNLQNQLNGKAGIDIINTFTKSQEIVTLGTNSKTTINADNIYINPDSGGSVSISTNGLIVANIDSKMTYAPDNITFADGTTQNTAASPGIDQSYVDNAVHNLQVNAQREHDYTEGIFAHKNSPIFTGIPTTPIVTNINTPSNQIPTLTDVQSLVNAVIVLESLSTGIRTIYNTFTDASNAMVDGDTIRIKKSVNYTGQYLGMRAGTLVIETGVVLNCKEFNFNIPFYVGSVTITGGGEMACPISIGPDNKLLINIDNLGLFSAQIISYDYASFSVIPNKITVTRTHWKAQQLFIGIYTFPQRQKFVQLSVRKCVLEISGPYGFSYQDENVANNGGNYDVTLGRTNNLLLLDNNVIIGVSTSIILDERFGTTAFQIGSNSYEGIPKPTQVQLVGIPGDVTLDTFSVLSYSNSIPLDFTTSTIQSIAATGNIIFTTTNRSLLKTKQVTITNTLNTPITISYEAWGFVGLAPITTLDGGKKLKLTIQCLGPDITNIEAANILFV